MSSLGFLQAMSTQGDGIIAWLTESGFHAVLILMVVVLVGLVVAFCRRTHANSRGNEKKF